jgi:hypothetical protein
MKTVVFTIADSKNLEWAKMCEKSFHHFHPDIPFIIYGEKEIEETKIAKPNIFYIATPYFARKLIGEYDQVLKIDADSIVAAPLDILDDQTEFDVATVYNWTRDKISDIVKVWDVDPKTYMNNGFVVFRSKEFLDHLWNLCSRPNVANYPFREQDILNILVFYGNYEVKRLDDGDSWYGLRSKSEWSKAVMENGLITLKKAPDMYPPRDKILRVLHWAGGNQDIKMNYRAYFNEEVSDYIASLLK